MRTIFSHSVHIYWCTLRYIIASLRNCKESRRYTLIRDTLIWDTLIRDTLSGYPCGHYLRKVWTFLDKLNIFGKDLVHNTFHDTQLAHFVFVKPQPTHRNSSSTRNNDRRGLKFCRRPYQAKLTTIQHNFNPNIFWGGGVIYPPPWVNPRCFF